MSSSCKLFRVLGIAVGRGEGGADGEGYVARAFARPRVAGGEQLVGGVFLQDVYTPHRAWELVAGIRGDYWMSSNGFRRDTPPPAGVPPSQLVNASNST